MKSPSVYIVLPVVLVGLVLALSMRAVIPESWLWILVLGLGLSGLIAVSSGFALNYSSAGTEAARSRRFFPGLVPVNGEPASAESIPVDSSPETECTVWDGF